MAHDLAGRAANLRSGRRGTFVGRLGGRGTLLRRAALTLLILFVAGTLTLSAPAVAGALTDYLQTAEALTPQEIAAVASAPRTAIVIVAAGRRQYAPEFGGETVDGLGLERLRYGATLARSTGLPVLVSGGLASAREASLADLMTDVLSRDYGVAVKWREDRSTNTAENAIYSAQILKRAGISRVLLVTHAWHMKRAEAAFSANGLTVIPAPTAYYRLRSGDSWWRDVAPNMRALVISSYALHETLGTLWYAFRYGY